jgi:hypothetical protein
MSEVHKDLMYADERYRIRPIYRVASGLYSRLFFPYSPSPEAALLPMRSLRSRLIRPGWFTPTTRVEVLPADAGRFGSRSGL